MMLALTGCDMSEGCVEAGGRSICAGENTVLVQGTSATWEVPEKYKFECTGVYLDDAYFDEVEPLKDPAGIVKFSPQSRFIVAYQVSNLGYELTDKDRESGTINLSSYWTTFRVNSGDDIVVRPYPWEDDDYKYDAVDFSDWEIPAVEIGETSEEMLMEIVSDTEIDVDKDVLVFTTFFNDGENTYTGVFEMKFQSLKKYLDSL